MEHVLSMPEGGPGSTPAPKGKAKQEFGIAAPAQAAGQHDSHCRG